MRRTIVAILILATVAPLHAGEEMALPPDERVAGMTQAEWSEAWWQWAGSFEYHESPVADRTGDLCASRQEGAVWFLAGTYGTARTIRTCRVPRGKFLFFPLINYVVMPRTGYRADCASFIEKAARLTERPQVLLVELDGRRLENLAAHRQATGCFDMGARATPPVRGYPSAANGYYVMLPPLPPGTHELNFGGILPNMTQAVTYTLVVD